MGSYISERMAPERTLEAAGMSTPEVADMSRWSLAAVEHEAATLPSSARSTPIHWRIHLLSHTAEGMRR